MRNCVTQCTNVYYDVIVKLLYVHVLVTWYYLWFSSSHRMWLLAWGSTYCMVSRIIEQQQAMCAVLASDHKHWHKMPSDAEFATLEAVCAVLEPLSNFTDALSGEKHVTVSAVHPLLDHILTSIVSFSSDDCTVVKEMKTIICEDLSSRYSAHSIHLLDKCSYLDPRFRSKYITEKQEVVAQIKEEAVAVINSLIPSPGEKDDGTSEDPPKKRAKGLATILLHSLGPSISDDIPAVNKIEYEIRRYEEYPSVDVEADPLVWWRNEQKHYPSLAKLAKKYLCVSGTSVPSERVFSTAGYIVNPLRNRLTPEHVNVLMFLAHNPH